jgi:DNA-binding NtrC family response regulator
MSTAKAALVESISKGALRGLPTRKPTIADRLNRVKDMAAALLDEAESLNHDNALAEASATIDNLDLKSGVNFFDEVKQFEIKLISRALELTGGNQAKAAQLLGLGTTTLNYKIKTYQML